MRGPGNATGASLFEGLVVVVVSNHLARPRIDYMDAATGDALDRFYAVIVVRRIRNPTGNVAGGHRAAV
jgi:hypothetical protein